MLTDWLDNLNISQDSNMIWNTYRTKPEAERMSQRLRDQGYQTNIAQLKDKHFELRYEMRHVSFPKKRAELEQQRPTDEDVRLILEEE